MSDAATAHAVLGQIADRFGPGFSNGVYAILAHEALPEVFDKEQWADWAFKPADSAFELAHDLGLIVPARLSSKWMMTDLGKDAGLKVRDALANSEGGGE